MSSKSTSKPETLETTALAVLAGMLSRKYKIHVQATGNTASCAHIDGEYVINIPMLATATPQVSELIAGYIDHEAAHVRYTPFDEAERVLVAHFNSNTLAQALLNIVEDVRIERELSHTFPGAAINLRKVATRLFCPATDSEDIALGYTLPVEATGDVAQDTLSYILRSLRGLDNPAIAATTSTFRAALSPTLTAALDPVLQRGTSLASYQDVVSLVEALMEILSQHTPQEASGGGSNGQDDAPCGSYGATSHNVTDGQPGASCDAPGERQDSLARAMASSRSAMREARERAQLGRVLQAGIQAATPESQACASRDCTVMQPFIPAPSEKKDENDKKSPSSGASCGTQQHPIFLQPLSPYMRNRAAHVASRLNASLLSMVQHRNLNREGRARNGRLDQHKLYRTALNDPRVFTRRTERIKPNAEIILLADASGSMSGKKAEITSLAVAALLQTLRRIRGVRSAAYAFGDDYVEPMLPFDVSLNQGQLCLCNPIGGTPGASALSHMLPLFSVPPVSPLPRRVVFFLSDGAVQDPEAFQIVARTAARYGIRVYGIGMESEIGDILPESDSISIREIEQLPHALHELTKRVLLV